MQLCHRPFRGEIRILGRQGFPGDLIKIDPDLGVGSPPHIFFSCE